MLQGLDPVMEGIVTDLERVTDFSGLVKMNEVYFKKHKRQHDSSDSDSDVPQVTGHDSDDERISPSAHAAAKTAAKFSSPTTEVSDEARTKIDNAVKNQVAKTKAAITKMSKEEK